MKESSIRFSREGIKRSLNRKCYDLVLSQKFAALKSGSHIIGIYANTDVMLSEALQFLRAGLDNGEALLLIIDQPSKEQIRKTIVEEWQSSIDEVIELEKKGVLLLRTSQEWYFPDGMDTSKLDVERTMMQWGKAVETVVKSGRKGLRAFGNMHYFFEQRNDLSKQLVDYEALLSPHMPFPLIGVCAYESQDIATLSPQQLATLNLHHSPQWADGYDVLRDPQNNQHIALTYEDEDQLIQSIANYINAGLEKNQLCVYSSILASQEDYIEKISLKIANYEHHKRNGDLLVINSGAHYISAMCDNFAPFEELKSFILSMVTDRHDKHVRFVSDCAGFLFKNKHFDECISLEKWWKGQSFGGSYLSPYPKSLTFTYPFNVHTFRAFLNHDIIVGSDGKIIASYQDDNIDGVKR